MPVSAARPRLVLRTLTRGDGLLGMKPNRPFGARAAPLSVVAQAPGAPPLTEAERARLAAAGLHPIEPKSLQWRSAALAAEQGPLWSLELEDSFGDFWADELPRLQAEGWSIVVAPGFAHQSLPIDAWRVVLQPDGAELLGHEPAQAWPSRGPLISPLAGSSREGAWRLSLGIEVAGESLDLAPLLANLLKREPHWLEADHVASLSDDAPVRLRRPNGRWLEATAGPLKLLVGTLIDLLIGLQRNPPSGLKLDPLDAPRLDALMQRLADTQAERAGPHGRWQLEGSAGLRAMAQRLREAGAPPPVAQPPGFGLALRPYQLHGLAWLQYLRRHHLAGILADDMGLGKTAQALAHVLVEQQAGRLDRPALVVLPTLLVFNWLAEARRLTPTLKVLVLQGPQRARDFGRIAEHDLVLTTYPLLWRDLRALAAQPYHLLIVDEAQTVKNASARAARALRRIGARHRLALTGTPLENHLGELWTQFDFLMPGFLGDARRFRQLWRNPIERNGEALRARLLAERVRPFILRRRKAEVATELPTKTEAVQRLQLQGRQRALYESVRIVADEKLRRVLDRRGWAGARLAVLKALLQLRQVCCDPSLVMDGGCPPGMERAKLEWIADMLPALVAEGRRVLVFSQFTRLLQLVSGTLDGLGLPHLVLSGRTPPDARGDIVGRFQALEVPVLLASLKAGGIGLNLTAADTVIHLEPWWNPAVEQQATDRAHRIGQTRPVTVYKLIVEGSIEDRMLALQTRKRVLADAVLGADAGDAVKFDEAALGALLAPLDQAT